VERTPAVIRETEHQWSGDCRRSVLEKGEFEWGADKMKMTVEEGRSGFRGSRRNCNCVAGRVVATTCG